MSSGPASPLAPLNPRDPWRAWVRSQEGEIVPPPLPCAAALSEARFLARRTHAGMPGILGLLDRGVVTLDLVLQEHLGEVSALMRRYLHVPMSLADACLVRMTETFADPVVLTTDADFRVYRRHSRHVVPCVTPH